VPGCVVGMVLLAAVGCWHQAGGDETHSGATGSGGVTTGNVSSLARAWVTKTGSPATSPIVYSGSVFSTAVGSSTGGKVSAYDTRDGAVRWSRSPVNGTGSPYWYLTLTKSAAGLEVPYDFVAAGGVLTLDPATGGQLAEVGGFHNMAKTSVVSKGDLNARAYAWISSGGPYWAFLSWGTHVQTLTLDSSLAISQPSIVGSHVIIGVGQQVLSFPLDCPTTNCASQWTRPLATVAKTPTGIDAHRVAVAGSAGDFTVLDTATGAILWTGHTPATSITVAASEDGIFVGGNDGTLYAFERDGCGASLCQPSWSASTGAGRKIVVQPMVAGEVVYVGTDNGNVMAFPATCPGTTCASLWTGVVDDAHAGGVSGLAADGGTIYATTSSGVLAAFRRPA
jgi:hypothetical protein